MTGELQAVVSELGGRSVLGARLRTEADLRSAIRGGLPHGVIRQLMRSSGLSLKELAAAVDISVRSLQRRRLGRLARHESDRIYRLARIVALAKLSLGDEAAGKRWLLRPNRALGGSVPIQMIDTEPGARAVENVLGRIAYGGVSCKKV